MAKFPLDRRSFRGARCDRRIVIC